MGVPTLAPLTRTGPPSLAPLTSTGPPSLAPLTGALPWWVVALLAAVVAVTGVGLLGWCCQNTAKALSEVGLESARPSVSGSPDVLPAIPAPRRLSPSTPPRLPSVSDADDVFDPEIMQYPGQLPEPLLLRRPFRRSADEA
ncbi:MAG: uncharacterized protein KVP18_003384 [Porospora cf. gigantea A]|uniref:uncharacterized protein n=1 Tax=Porospora cf. gigantea A TaxID=2853593 RepID=UPI00355A1965|nr:MAG: hypothetical protein KVP18_003384 [Porospora cf. gigantea A]